jgi:hypothetical protein
MPAKEAVRISRWGFSNSAKCDSFVCESKRRRS